MGGDTMTTTVRVDAETSRRFTALAAEEGMSVRAYLARLSEQAEAQKHLMRATASFEDALSPDVLEAFDRRYGGAPADHSSSRAA
ncbi:antitoxin MazE7 [Streptomyces sp. NPDC004647]|uniref:antitoxin MazE7 n=1 Tax=Streptomyces sp. NPDC004647 TaxID=3154671 RepID=UPI0033BB3680